MANITRRNFIEGTAAAGLLVAANGKVRAADASNTVVLALMGANNRGSQLAERFAKRSDIRIAYVCDPDEKAIPKGIKAATSQGAPAPKGIKDFRRALEDPAVDALICAAPNHWHATATIMACQAGKHVYLEKPCSHTPEEGELMIAAVKKTGKVVQVGMQRRSGTLYQEIHDKVRDGIVGDPLYCKSWYYRNRPTLGRAKPSAPPKELDYGLWQGPAPVQPYRENILHYNWHFFWDWGNGELGNNGVHTIDLCRWFMGVDYPSHVSATGSRIRYKDDQQTPDTALANFDCEGRSIVWEGVSWSDPYVTGGSVGVELRGTEGTLIANDKGYTVYDLGRKTVLEGTGTRGDDEHIANFLDAIRNSAKLNADIVDGHKSAMFCHLGNISMRRGNAFSVSPTTGHIQDDPQANQLWGREYNEQWDPRKLV